MRKLAMILLILSILLPGCRVNQESQKDLPVSAKKQLSPRDYLRDNYTPININSTTDFSDFALLEKDVLNNTVFLTGEYHSVQLNFPIQTKLLFYLNQKAGVTRYLAEVPYSVGEYYNLYLKTGDEKLFTYLALEARGTHGEIDDTFTMLKNIYHYNKELPEEKRIFFLGIDGETVPNVALSYINMLIKEKPLSIDGLELFSRILAFIKEDGNGFEQGTDEKYKEYVKNLIEHVEDKKEMYKNLLGDDFDSFMFTIKNLQNGINEMEALKISAGEFNVVREGIFKKNFAYWIQKLNQNTKFFGEWGRDHIFLSELATRDPVNYYSKQIPHLGQILNEEIPRTKGKVISIAYMYKDSHSYQPHSNIRSAPFEDDFFDIEKLDMFAETDTTLFKLNGKNSPFWKETLFLDRPIKDGTANYFQYAVLIKNSKASQAYFKK
ncbi:hypothetical protein A8F94_21965 [Bacillus sp. FJAT-27225]|uniref:hypothetical protein n=1 Tax=Bacillus sp. FJAT-27225 TaxID=1743144 RepID=UPI00080C26AA|nr:hypothetical protein [Bacillus sp. FJAT-27225]OCA81542.1 hypothetical protein A8F94_21965 [Bacillus sp. FJAT-27225]